MAGISPRMVRYHHRTGALPEPGRTPNGYRDYTVDDVARLIRLTTLTDAGIPATAVDSVTDHHDLLKDALLAVDSRIGELHRQRARILSLLNGTRSVPRDIGNLLDALRSRMSGRGTCRGPEVPLLEQDIRALHLMVDAGMTTADTWALLRSSLASEQAGENSRAGYRAWDLLGSVGTADPQVPELVACCRRGILSGVFAGLTATLLPGDLPLTVADIPATGAQSVALTALLPEVGPGTAR